MKDLVDNRKRMTLGTKLRVLGLTLKENGLLYTMLLGIYYGGSSVADRAFAAMQRLRKSSGLPASTAAVSMPKSGTTGTGRPVVTNGRPPANGKPRSSPTC